MPPSSKASVPSLEGHKGTFRASMKWDHLCGLVDAEPIVDIGSWRQTDNLNSQSYRPSLLLGSCDGFPTKIRANASNGLQGLLPSFPQTALLPPFHLSPLLPRPLHRCPLCSWASPQMFSPLTLSLPPKLRVYCLSESTFP